MHDLIDLLSAATGGFDFPSFSQEMIDVSNPTLILMAVMSFLGTNLMANMTGRDLFLEQLASFAAFFVSALVANAVFSHMELPVGSEFAQTGISSNIGMTIAGLVLLLVFSREGAYRRT